ncbi:MAG TPA: M20 family metallopeptidase [Fimbriimonas sp.]|nr:M20 family metallopeptidase [Fimbriimonas sp.]
MSPFREEFAPLLSKIVSIRHDLHAHPELGYQEKRTSEAVQKLLTEWGIEHKAGLAGGTGVLARIPATGSDGGTVALRADMDALPICEQTGVSYESKHPGVMHACGHDGHTSILLATARVLSQARERRNEILLLFQPAEEGGAGGKRMCDEGALNGGLLGKTVDVIYGLHGFPRARLGDVSTRVGPLLAAASMMRIEVRGVGSHAAYPHLGIDPIVVCSHIVTALQTIASRSVNPLDSVVVTIGKIDAGVAHNVIPESANLIGTLRTLHDETNRRAIAAIERISQRTAEAFGATANVHWEAIPYPVTRNEAGATERFRKIARGVLGEQHVLEEPEPSMGGEDFSFYGQHVPACFFFLGLLPEGQETYPNLHAPTFDFNDDAIPAGVEVMRELALSPL